MSLLYLVCLLLCLHSLVASVSSNAGPLIVQDNFSNGVFLPNSGDAHLGYSIAQPAINISPYTLTVHSLTPTTAFYVNDAFGQAVLSGGSSELGSVEKPLGGGVGDFVYRFTIPTSGRLLFNMSYTSDGADHVQVLISAFNPHGEA